MKIWMFNDGKLYMGYYVCILNALRYCDNLFSNTVTVNL